MWCFFALTMVQVISFFPENSTKGILLRPLLVIILVLIFGWYYSSKLSWHAGHFISKIGPERLLTVEPHGKGTNNIDFSEGKWRIEELPITYTFPVPEKGNPWYPRKNTVLEMRKPGDLSKGFRLTFGDDE
jgi:hypothetical protein